MAWDRIKKLWGSATPSPAHCSPHRGSAERDAGAAERHRAPRQHCRGGNGFCRAVVGSGLHCPVRSRGGGQRRSPAEPGPAKRSSALTEEQAQCYGFESAHTVVLSSPKGKRFDRSICDLRHFIHRVRHRPIPLTHGG